MSEGTPAIVRPRSRTQDEAGLADEALLMRDVRFTYRSTGFALHVPRFHLAAGEAVFLRGPSGSGKTTFLSLATGLLATESGEIAVAGEAMPERAARRDRLRASRIGVIHQQFNLLPYLDTLSNVLLPGAFRAGTTSSREEAHDLLTRLGVPEDLHAAPARALSVGQQQRVAIVRALLGTPALVVADEPTSALDVDARNAFLDLLFENVETVGAALLMVSHDPAIGARFAVQHDLREIASISTGGAL